IIQASPTSLSLSQVQSQPAVTATSTLTNVGNTTGTYTSQINYTHGTGFLAISPTTASLTKNGGTQVVTFTCTPGTLAPDTYTANVVFTLGTSTATVSVSFTVTASTEIIQANPTSLTLAQVQGGTAVTATSTLTNVGSTTGTYT